jgi:hypothetical protein
MDCHILLDLPEAVSRLVLVEWIRFKDVGRLDSAICNRECRKLFLTLVNHPLTVFTSAIRENSYCAHYKLILKWVVIRTAHLEGIIIDDAVLQCQRLLFTFLTISGSTISWVSITCRRLFAADYSLPAFLKIAKVCPNLQNLSVQAEWNGTGVLWDTHVVTVMALCPKLTSVTLSNVKLSEQGLANAMKYCKCLQRLSTYTADQAIPIDIALSTLKTIECDSRLMTDAVLIAISQQCAKLKTLTMFAWDHQVTDAGVRAVLQGCPLLEDTDVERAVRISVELRAELARRRRVTTLYARDWLGMSDELAQAVLKVSPKLTVLRCVESCGWLTDATLAVCAKQCPLVKKLTLSECPFVSNAGVRALVSSLGSNLRVVNLKHCAQLGDDALLAVAEHCPLLKNFVCKANMSDAAVAKLAEGCPHLAYAFLYSPQVGDASLSALTTHCRRLKTLDVFGCPGITIEGVRALLDCLPSLETMSMPGHLRDLPLPQREIELDVQYV